MLYGISYFSAEFSRLEAGNSQFMAEKSHLLAENSRLTAENSLLMSKNKLIQGMIDSLRIKQRRDAEKITDLENELAALEPSAKMCRDAEKIDRLKTELDSMFSDNEFLNKILDIAKESLTKSNRMNKEQKEKIKNLEEHLGSRTDFENMKKKITEMQLEDHTDFKNSKKIFTEWPQLKPHPELERLENLLEQGMETVKKKLKKFLEAEALERLSMLDPDVD
jgi:myosin heavy subunit